MTTTIWRAMVRLAAMALPVAVVACISGTDQPLGPVGQVIKPINGGGGSSGTGGGNVTGQYHLASFNGATFPDTIVNFTFTNIDSSRTVVAILDSAWMQLDSGTATEIDYFQLSPDIRQASGFPGPQPFNFSTSGGGSQVACVGGTYADTLATQTAFQLQGLQCFTFGYTFPRLSTTYTVAGDSLVGASVTYQYFDSAATTGAPVYQSNVALVWKLFTSTLAQRPVAAPRGATRAQRIVIRRD